MDRGDIVAGAAFKAVLRSAAVFLVVFFLGALLSLEVLEKALTGELRKRVVELHHGLADVANASEEVSLADHVATLSRGAAGETLAYALYGSDGTRLAGNVDVRLEPGEWAEIPLAIDGRTNGTEPFLLHANQIGDTVLVSGRSLSFVSLAKAAMMRGFAIAGIVLVFCMLAIGYVMSARSQRKLERIETVLDGVSSGDFGLRIGLSEQRDQIGRISRRIDGKLAKLESLMQGTRRTTAAIAHDLRRPLSRVSLGLEKALAKAEAGQDARAEIEDALAGLDKLTAIISTILRIARIEDENIGDMQAFDLRPLLDEIAETYRPVIEDNAQTFEYVTDKGPALVLGDKDMIAQLAVNILQNAITHAGAGAKLSLRARQSETGTEIVVSDTGPGIPDALMQHVFDPLYRADAARTLEGNGLGLTLVKAIVDRHRAQILLSDNRPGLCVTVTFPKGATADD